ncbi:MAG: rubrerythrin family protein [Candidatus Harrisonbacteria bacterium CG10_big_fil_rev_8_21_14_0_10_49_15]|uniref:Rubrerythrin family protein n=1 Tax=Candidatus Harrisonbacteria bacterium CG10_big_fil_rev_8_21_14_0_10_49_15 TaxID=1974587 RepID=A0A2H0UM80_9BACT|nr:MAG: rubrerythrin family protein [Candidatus Harrisonbacteria bacterium CG10_big_fil_rev_8_21_14_0_10_49_15]
MTPYYFAYKQKLDWLVYKDLASREKDKDLKAVLEKLIDHELADYKFWQKMVAREIQIPHWKIVFFRGLRTVFGLTFTARFLEGRERGMIEKYTRYLVTIEDAGQRAELKKIIEHERFHEEQFLSLIKEEKVDFVSSIVLGMNDGLIELTGALAGFSFALQNHLVVALAGTITGISASLSMAASAYMQAKHEKTKNPKKAATYTSVSYFLVVIILVAPYFLISQTMLALAVMIGLVLLIIAGMTFYTSTVFQENFGKNFGEMALFSLGVAVIAFGIGVLFRTLTGIEL